MDCGSKLAMVAIITGLRQSGVIDKRAVKSIIEAMTTMAAQSREHCAETADSLLELATALQNGPARSCLPAVPVGVFGFALNGAENRAS